MNYFIKILLKYINTLYINLTNIYIIICSPLCGKRLYIITFILKNLYKKYSYTYKIFQIVKEKAKVESVIIIQ